MESEELLLLFLSSEQVSEIMSTLVTFKDLPLDPIDPLAVSLAPLDEPLANIP